MVAPRQARKSFRDQVLSGAYGPPSDNVEWSDTRQYQNYDNGGNGPWDVLQQMQPNGQPVPAPAPAPPQGQGPAYDPFRDPGANWQPSVGSASSRDPSLRDATAYWLSKVWFGDNREGVEKAKRFLDVASIAVPQVGANIAANEITNVVRDAYNAATSGKPTSEAARAAYNNALWTAAFGMLPGRLHGRGGPTPAKHISPHDFNAFDINKIGGGEGTAFEGPGIYAMHPQSPTDLVTYGPQFSAPGFTNDKGDIFTNDQVLHDLIGHAKSLKSEVPVDLAMAARDYAMHGDESRFTGIGTSLERRLMKGYVKDNYPYYADVPPLRYDINIHADPASMLKLEKPLSQQPKHLQKGLIDLLHEMYPPQRLKAEDISQIGPMPIGLPSGALGLTPHQYEVSRQWHVPSPALGSYQANPNRTVNLSAVGTSVDKAMKKLDALVSYKKNAAPIRAINEYFDTGARDKYLGIGAPVLTYGDYDAGTHYKHPNYVTFDDRLLEILRKARMADPGLLKTKP